MSLGSKINDNKDKLLLQKMFGKKPKHRCPTCHKFTFWVNKKLVNKKLVNSRTKECAMCQMILLKKEENK